MEGAETCCALKDGEFFRKSWVEWGRHHLLDLSNNRRKAVSTLFCLGRGRKEVFLGVS